MSWKDTPPEDAAKFELWKPKIQAYLDAREAAVPKQYLLPESKLPPADQLNVANLPYTSGAMTAEELVITETGVPQLAKKIADGDWSSVQVLEAFLKRAVMGNQLLNFATTFIADDAMERAKELDEIYAKTGKTVGPLHGVPVSIKEHIGFKGKPMHGGFVSRVDFLATEDAVTVRVLKEQGAVPFVRTNIPQSLMHADSSNYIVGATKNCLNLKLSAGGSSGGEGSIVGFKGSPVGVGTDIGGSIRFPAAFNGCYGLRPTSYRVSGLGCGGAGGGQESIKSVMGPISQHVEDLDYFMESYLGGEPWKYDGTLLVMPWRKVVPSKAITVGIMWNDGVVETQPGILRGLRFLKEKLEAQGIKVVDWEPYKVGEIWEESLPLFYADGLKAQLTMLGESGEPIHPLTRYAFQGCKEGGLTVSENWAYNRRRDSFRTEYLALMQKRGVDFIVNPVYWNVTPRLHETKYWSHTTLWNYLDHPCVAMPTGLFMDPKLDTPQPREFLSTFDEEIQSLVGDAQDYIGAPLTFQVVGKRYHDEETVAAAKVLDAALKA
ncbi:unnamed protein product [Kuraishia capsulata CBS 1993]|uniref:amidase n=1 Tax=Kuraishia capsulata CBS 1993 TaxID=1382522 RepID=W6MTS8_9ASCO|nr:uncharacterized protein KUCA_T00001187001 [Kuraishia capsulata CBS 1993]CDK25220.1 unnamed protein product [Kuraishia capsulata CBS 1993]